MTPPLPRNANLKDDAEDEFSASLVLVREAYGYVDQLRGFFVKKVGNKDDADELVQELFVRLLNRKSTEPVTQIKPYLFRTALNVWRDWERKIAVRGGKGSHEPYDETVHLEEKDSGFQPDHVLERKEVLDNVLVALNKLPERMRDILILRSFEGLKTTEVAQLMGISTRAVEMNKAKALARLSIVLENTLEGIKNEKT